MPRTVARTAIRRTAINMAGSNNANNNGVLGAVTLQSQIGACSQSGKSQLQILAQPEQQHRARYRISFVFSSDFVHGKYSESCDV